MNHLFIMEKVFISHFKKILYKAREEIRQLAKELPAKPKIKYPDLNPRIFELLEKLDD